MKKLSGQMPENKKSLFPLSTVISCVMVIIVSGLYFIVIPSFKTMFEEIGKGIPFITSIIVEIPRFSWPILGLSVMSILVLKNTKLRESLRTTIDIIVIVVAAASVLVLSFALFLPLIVIINIIE